MKYIENLYNAAVQRAINTIMHFQQQASVADVQKELEEFIKNHKVQDIAIWVVAIQNVNQRLLSKVMEIQEAEVVDE